MAEDGRFDHIELQDNVIYESIEATSTEKHLQKIRQSDVRRYKRGGVGVGLLCAVLALLNVAVPLHLYKSNVGEIHQWENRYNKLTEERDCLKRMLCESGGFTFDDGLCYYISTEKKTWEESRQWCRDKQSDLIVIKSKEKQDFVELFNKKVWLGLSDREKERSFQWVDGTPLTTPTYWGRRQPNNINRAEDGNKEQDCVEFLTGRGPTAGRGWNDRTCNYSNYWICERALC